MGTIRDDSEDWDIVDGYCTNQVIASEVGSNEITPLNFSLYSQEKPDFISENIEIIKAFNKLGEAFENIGIPDFKYYTLGDGLSNIFIQYPEKLIKPAEIFDSQLNLGFG